MKTMKKTGNGASGKPSAYTFGELKAMGYKPRSVHQELRENLISFLKKGENPFTGIHGYDETVIPQLQHALLSGHHILLLGLRGQAKTRLARLMVALLDEWMPIVAGSEIHDDPFAPLSLHARERMAELQDNCTIDWVHRDDRYVEKLATPDVTVADLIGDIDPIKAANMGLSYSDPRVIHFGMIPRANRSIFVINELPDLQPRIQVSLFNILQEGDVQIRGFQLRWPLDLQFVFTANPEDYTNRGSIVTPLKDRIGSQILTHYPEDVETAMKITEQEVRQTQRAVPISFPEPAQFLLEQIAFEARESSWVDGRSGVSARMTITARENLFSAAERRALLGGLKETSIRLIDFLAVIPAMTGKVELVYEGEQEGPDHVAESLIGEAIKTLTPEFLPPMDKLKRSDEKNAYAGVIDWFSQGDELELNELADDAAYAKALAANGPLHTLIHNKWTSSDEGTKTFMMEWVLWALSEHNKLNRDKLGKSLSFRDLFSSYLSGTTES